MSLTIYQRIKVENKGWRYQAVKVGPGRKTGDLTGPFYIFPSVQTFSGKSQQWVKLDGETFAEAQTSRDQYKAGADAQAKGLTVAELATASNRVSAKFAIEQFLHLRRSKRPKTLMAYKLGLAEFLESFPSNVRFMDEVATKAKSLLEGYKTFLEAKGYEPKTQHNRLLIACFFLKANGIDKPSRLIIMPTVEEEEALPYENEQLEKLFAAMDSEETARYKFFLGSACRDKEVTFAAWTDINFKSKTYTVRSKMDVGFAVKNHESRTVPLPDDLVELLKARKQNTKNPPHPRWIFVNEEGRPDNHFLRKMKRIALHAGLNCGQCVTTVTKGKYDGKHEVEVTCETDPVCEHWYLHRMRKTCATRWMTAGVPIRNIQKWLGHKSLETTEKYLGSVPMDDRMQERINRAASGD